MPWGGSLRRTEPNGPPTAPIAILGVYPAATRLRRWLDPTGTTRTLPAEIEERSFQAESASGHELDDRYLTPLGLTRAQIYAFDVMPYVLANMRISSSGRSMNDNIAEYCRHHGLTSPIQPRPQPDALLALSRALPGNLERLTEYLHSSQRRLLITLGNEAAAFVRGYTRSADAQQHLYALDERVNILGGQIRIVHLAHPGLIMQKASWAAKHASWCQEVGVGLIAAILR